MEVDGVQHFRATKLFGVHKYKHQRRRDTLVNSYCVENNIMLLRLVWSGRSREFGAMRRRAACLATDALRTGAPGLHIMQCDERAYRLMTFEVEANVVHIHID